MNNKIYSNWVSNVPIFKEDCDETFQRRDESHYPQFHSHVDFCAIT